MEIDWKFFQFAYWKMDSDGGKGCWFRIFGYGLHFKSGRMSFSERNEFVHPFRIGRHWRIGTLKPVKAKQ